MPIVSGDLILYGPQSNPTDDSSAAGGAINRQYRPVFTQLLANSTLVYQSSASDVRVIQAIGRDATGSVVTESVALNGTNAVSGTQIFERLQMVSLTGGASGAQTVTVGGSGVGVGGGGLGTIPATELGFYMLFRNSSSSSSTLTRYEKVFYRNSHATLTLQSALIQLAADPSAVLQMGLETAKNDSTSIANRLAVPGGVSFVGVGVDVSVPGTTLEAGSYISAWIKQALAANNAAIRASFTTQLAGSTV